MSEYEMMQWAGLAAGGVVVGAGIYGFVGFSKKLDAMWGAVTGTGGLIAYLMHGDLLSVKPVAHAA